MTPSCPSCSLSKRSRNSGARFDEIAIHRQHITTRRGRASVPHSSTFDSVRQVVGSITAQQHGVFGREPFGDLRRSVGAVVVNQQYLMNDKAGTSRTSSGTAARCLLPRCGRERQPKRRQKIPRESRGSNDRRAGCSSRPASNVSVPQTFLTTGACSTKCDISAAEL